MPPLLRTDRPLDRRRRVLALLEELADDLAAVDLDAVDGEFYWRICRLDLLNQVEARCAALPPAVAAARDNASHREEPSEVFAILRQQLRHAAAVRTMEAEIARLYPEVVWRRLLDGERVPMRAAEAEVRRPFGGAPQELTGLRLRVFSGAWTGADVEAEVQRLDTDPARRLVPGSGPSDGTVEVRVAFAFGDAARARSDAWDDEPPRFPYVEVAVPFPLPLPGVVGREYDAVVRQDLGWHLALPGAETRQDKEVALRTWAVGLLAADGERVAEAMRQVCARAGVQEVSQSRFGQDRQRLLERVPEARPFLFARGDRPGVLANPVGLAALANPDDPPSPLQVS